VRLYHHIGWADPLAPEDQNRRHEPGSRMLVKGHLAILSDGKARQNGRPVSPEGCWSAVRGKRMSWRPPCMNRRRSSYRIAVRDAAVSPAWFAAPSFAAASAAQLLVERVDVGPDSVDVRPRTEGLTNLMSDLRLIQTAAPRAA
jgi:hypothetical protein